MHQHKINDVHLIGIGGAGLSALAGWLKEDGYNVTGCDEVVNERTKHLLESGIQVTKGHSVDHVLDQKTWVIYSSAITKTSTAWIEYSKAKKQGNKLSSYVEALGEISNKYNLIAVAGAHGKTTTTMMIGRIFEGSGKDPNYIVGEGIYRHGNSNIFIIEACEYKRNFLNYKPNVLLITNIALDHPDYYKDLDDVKSAFISLVANIKQGGTLVCHKDHYYENAIKDVLHSKNIKVVLYGDDNIIETIANGWGTISKVSVEEDGNNVFTLTLDCPGKHNVLNAIASIIIVKQFGIDSIIAADKLKGFTGVKRRLEKIGEYKGIPIISDWAHHPDQITTVYQSLTKIYSKSKILVFFEPHQYERTWKLFPQFVKALSPIQNLNILPIYNVKGRESQSALKNTSSERLAREINIKKDGNKVNVLQSQNDIDKLISKETAMEAFLFLSAGPLDDYIRGKYGIKTNKYDCG